MFVFPAFNQNYNTRKRAFASCGNCRAHKIKCHPSKNYETNGCDDCIKSGANCDLITETKSSGDTKRQKTGINLPIKKDEDASKYDRKDHDSLDPAITLPLQITPDRFEPSGIHLPSTNIEVKDPVPIDKRDLPLPTIIPNENKDVLSNYSIQAQVSSTNLLLPVSNVPITEEYLKTTFGFNMCGPFSKSRMPFLMEPKPRDIAPIGQLSHLSFQYLHAMNAFKIPSEEFPIYEDDIRDLIHVFFVKINRMLPMIPEREFWIDFNSGNTPTLLIFAILTMSMRDSLSYSIRERIFLRRVHKITNPYVIPESTADVVTEIVKKMKQLLLHLPALDDENKFVRLIAHISLSSTYSYFIREYETFTSDMSYAVNCCISLNFHRAKGDSELDRFKSGVWSSCQFLTLLNQVVNMNHSNESVKQYTFYSPGSQGNHMHLDKMIEMINKVTGHKQEEVATLANKEFYLCESEMENDNWFNSSPSVAFMTSSLNDFEAPNNSYNSKISYFFTRLVTNSYVLANAKEEIQVLTAAENILYYLYKADANVIIGLPIIPWCIQISFFEIYFRCVLSKSLPTRFEEYLSVLRKVKFIWRNVDHILFFSWRLRKIIDRSDRIDSDLEEFRQDLQQYRESVIA